MTDHLRLDLRLLLGKIDQDHVAELKPLSVDLNRHELEYRPTLSALRKLGCDLRGIKGCIASAVSPKVAAMWPIPLLPVKPLLTRDSAQATGSAHLQVFQAL
jgi:hypothetical protein